jgi:outer membrane protein
MPYIDQFNNNFSSVVGLSVRIPILNGFQAKNVVALEKIQLEETSIDLQDTKLEFKQSIEEAYLKMESAFNRHHLLIGQVTAYEQSFHTNEIRFNNGVSNIVEYLTSKNNLDAAKLNLSKAKYEYILRVRVLDYYRGL